MDDRLEEEGYDKVPWTVELVTLEEDKPNIYLMGEYL